MSEETTKDAAQEVVRKALTRTGLPYMGPMPHMEGEITDALAQAILEGRAQGLLEAAEMVKAKHEDWNTLTRDWDFEDAGDAIAQCQSELDSLAQAIQRRAEETGE